MMILGKQNLSSFSLVRATHAAHNWVVSCYGVLSKSYGISRTLSNVTGKVCCLVKGQFTVASSFPKFLSLNIIDSKPLEVLPSLEIRAITQFQSNPSWLATHFDFFKTKIRHIVEHPYAKVAKRVFIIKQTADFALGSMQWWQSKRSDKSMLQITINTAITYIPFAINLLTSGTSLSTQIIGNAILIGCLALSAGMDIRSLRVKECESSPTVQIFKNYFWIKLIN